MAEVLQAPPAGLPLGEHRVTGEYGLSLADLERVMPRLLPTAELTRDGRAFCLRPAEGGEIEIRPGPPRERRIAGLRLPCLDLEFVFRGLDPAARAAFHARFGRCFQKGGG